MARGCGDTRPYEVGLKAVRGELPVVPCSGKSNLVMPHVHFAVRLRVFRKSFLLLPRAATILGVQDNPIPTHNPTRLRRRKGHGEQPRADTAALLHPRVPAILGVEDGSKKDYGPTRLRRHEGDGLQLCLG